MKRLWRIALVVVVILLPACKSERQKMIEEAERNTPRAGLAEWKD